MSEFDAPTCSAFRSVRKVCSPYITATNLPFLYIDGGIAWGAQILEVIRLIRTELVSQTPYYELKVASALLDMWTLLIKNGYALEYDASEMTRSRRMKDMLQWIHLNYADPVRLEDIARTGQLSRSETCRYFKQILRTTPMQYVMDYRIQKALNFCGSRAEASPKSRMRSVLTARAITLTSFGKV